MCDFRTAGERLLGQPYQDDFDEHFWEIDSTGFWKLERRQEFREPGDDSWVAFTEGRWADALALLEERRASLAAHYRRIAERGFDTLRVRVVERPLSPYLRWELRLLLLRHELGGRTRIVTAEQVREFEPAGPLPELVTLGDRVMYEILYDDDGVQYGAVRFAEQAAIARGRELIQGLYADGEDVDSFFHREVAGLALGCG
ncbi:DUF6879 family protein [Actinokineospora enzanensis]|uniref:DUF6879 family protein n=1 Tax=Actinokineospora enzanensis TaxID=155975 RepID=UPI0003625868|nr:DUF6879 family protein [Actinokineospora enzanensis]